MNRKPDVMASAKQTIAARKEAARLKLTVPKNELVVLDPFQDFIYGLRVAGASGIVLNLDGTAEPRRPEVN